MSQPTDPKPSPARSFGGVAEAYERGRPGYPAAAAAWLTGSEDGEAPHRPLSVLELGAGTGKLTAALVEAGHHVHATEPDPGMLDLLVRRLPDVPVSQVAAEDLPFPDQAFDVVVAGQCFHWFDPEVAMPEIGRVLRTGGLLSLVWNLRDERIPWVRRFGPVLGTQDQLHVGSGSASALDDAPWFGEVETASFSQWQTVDRRTVLDLALSRSHIASLDAAGRERKLAEVLAFYDEYGRGMDGMKVPYVTRCFRTPLVQRDGLPATLVESTGADDPAGDGPDDPQDDVTSEAEGGEARGDAESADGVPTDPPRDHVREDSGVLLIDFR